MDFDELSKMYDFSGMSIMITGGAGIVGANLAARLIVNDHDVVIFDEAHNIEAVAGDRPALLPETQGRADRFELSVALAAGSALLLALAEGGVKGGLALWPVFGASNQLLAALALTVITLWLMRRGKPIVYTALPMAFMLAVTVTPLGSRPARTPQSAPICGDPSRSSPPASSAPSVSAMARTRLRPMRPPAPTMAMRIISIGSILSCDGAGCCPSVRPVQRLLPI